jgi:hypothetical protein
MCNTNEVIWENQKTENLHLEVNLLSVFQIPCMVEKVDLTMTKLRAKKYIRIINMIMIFG